jgi:hypothetical protein
VENTRSPPQLVVVTDSINRGIVTHEMGDNLYNWQPYIRGDQAEEERELKGRRPINTGGAKLSEIAVTCDVTWCARAVTVVTEHANSIDAYACVSIGARCCEHAIWSATIGWNSNA